LIKRIKKYIWLNNHNVFKPLIIKKLMDERRHWENREEKTIMRIDNNPDSKISNMAEGVKRNPWMIASFILGIAVIILLFLVFRGGITGNVVSGEDAGEKIVEYLNGMTKGGVEYVSEKDIGNLYEITVSYQGKNIPVYITKDGEYFVQGAVPITGNAIDNAETEAPTEVVKSDKPVVELFIMSHCPYGTQAEKGIIPVFELLKTKIDAKIRFVNYAMHGEKEIYEELNQYCIQKEQSDKFYPYLKCFLGKTGSEADGKACLTEVKIDTAKLEKCTKAADTEFEVTKYFEDKSSWASGRFPLFKIDDALNKEYGVQGSPTLVINGKQVSSGRDSASYLKTICSAFNSAPAECDTALSSASPSSGFGYAAASASASNNAAQCG